MLTENEVIDLLAIHLEANHYRIVEKRNTREKGIDLLASKGNEITYIEAKGARSARVGSARFAQGFSLKQVRTHVSVAVFACMKQMNLSNSRNSIAKYGIALPDNDDHIKMIECIAKPLKLLKIAVYFVSTNGVRKVVY